MSASLALPFVPGLTLACAAVVGVIAWRMLPLEWSGRRTAVVAGLITLVITGLLVASGVLSAWGALTISVHAMFLVLGFVACWVASQRRASALGVDGHQLRDLFAVALVLGIVGARARFVYERWDRFTVGTDGQPIPLTKSLELAANLDAGGAVWYGGALLATVGVIALLWARRHPILAFGDVILPGLLIGLGIGRIGCFFNGCCYGAPTDLPWAVACPVAPHDPVHPAQLYETIATWTLGGLLWWWYPRRRHDGQILFLAVAGYALWRFFNEGLRGGHDALTTWFGHQLTTSQATSLELLVSSLVGYVALRWWRRHKGLANQRLPEQAQGAKDQADG